MSNPTLALKRFNPDAIAENSILYMQGKRNTGKSFLLKDLLYHKQDLPVGMVISKTEASNRFYGDFVPELFIHDEFHDNIVQEFVDRQRYVSQKRRRELTKNGVSKIDARGFLIFDDCIFDKSWTKSKDVRHIFMNGRHDNITFLMTSQYPLGIPPDLRNQIDYVFLLRDTITRNRKITYENFAGMFPTFEIFSTVLDQVTDDYGCLVIYNGSHSNRLEDQVFWYKAEPHDSFRLGSSIYWDYCEKYCKSADDENTNDFTSSTNGSKTELGDYAPPFGNTTSIVDQYNKKKSSLNVVKSFN